MVAQAVAAAHPSTRTSSSPPSRGPCWEARIRVKFSSWPRSSAAGCSSAFSEFRIVTHFCAPLSVSPPARYFAFQDTMPTVVTPPRPGRPTRHPVDQLATRIWFSYVKHQTGLPSAYAIERTMEPDCFEAAVDGVDRPRNWGTYEAGDRIPRRSRSGDGPIEKAQARVPGSADVLESPMWAGTKARSIGSGSWRSWKRCALA